MRRPTGNVFLIASGSFVWIDGNAARRETAIASSGEGSVLRTVSIDGERYRMITAGFASGDVPTVKANHTLVKNVSLVGVYWGRYTLEKPAETREAATQIWDIHRGGRLDPLVTVEGSMTDALTQSEAVAGGGTTGKIVLRW